MARTAGVPKADKSLKGPEIDWTGNVIRDGRGYYGEAGAAAEKPAGAFPPAVPSGPDDVSRRRFSPAEALKREIAAQATAAPSALTQVTYRDGAEVVTPPAPKKKPNKLVEYMARIKADPAAFAQYMEKQKAGYRKWLEKRKEKNA